MSEIPLEAVSGFLEPWLISFSATLKNNFLGFLIIIGYIPLKFLSRQNHKVGLSGALVRRLKGTSVKRDLPFEPTLKSISGFMAQ